MLHTKKESKCFISSESSKNNLPTEVWILSWSFLDFNTVQKKCTLVSKEWLNGIRNSTRLSNLKNVKCWLNVCTVHGHLEKRYVERFFKKGLKIVENTFPIESTDFCISDVQYEFSIEKEYNKKATFHA